MSSSPKIRWESYEEELRLTAPPESTLSSSSGSTLYLFLDESGNLDFGQNGSKFFFMTCVVARRPLALNDSMTDLRHDFVENGIDIELFHASEDIETVRKSVYGLIAGGADTLAAYSIRIDKRAMPDELKDPAELYSRVFGEIVREVSEKEARPDVKRVVVITDSLPKEATRRQVEKPLKSFMKEHFVKKRGIPYILVHHHSCSSTYLQIADYLSWAAHRQFTNGMDWPMRLVRRCFREIGEVGFENKEEGEPE